MPEVWFYHLEREPVEHVLPGLLQRGVARGLKLSVEAPSVTRLQQISESLWSLEDVAFVPHGMADDPQPDHQPLFLSLNETIPNNADYRFYVDGAEPQSVNTLTRASILFDGNSEDALAQARGLWKKFKTEGHAIRYWKQSPEGKWQDQSATGA